MVYRIATFIVAVVISFVIPLFFVEAWENPLPPGPAFSLTVPTLTTPTIQPAPVPTLQPSPQQPAAAPKARRATATGTIKAQGVTTYMYGTHVLVGKDGRTLYALKSDRIRLDQYLGGQVTVSGVLLEGYPVDGGPQYMSVDSISY